VAVSPALRRLLRVLTIEEEQCRLILESAIESLRQLERAYAATSSQARVGRKLVVSSAQTGELPDRLAGMEETRSAKKRAIALVPRLAEAETEVEECRRIFLAKRVECRQAETLIREAEARDALIAGRRAQQGLDDWYLNRFHGHRDDSKSPISATSESSGNPPWQARTKSRTKT
jgi:flagellar biosynthesis chaperone FliJ